MCTFLSDRSSYRVKTIYFAASIHVFLPFKRNVAAVYAKYSVIVGTMRNWVVATVGYFAVELTVVLTAVPQHLAK